MLTVEIDKYTVKVPFRGYTCIEFNNNSLTLPSPYVSQINFYDMLRENVDFYKKAIDNVLALKPQFIKKQMDNNLVEVLNSRMKWAIPPATEFAKYVWSRPLDTSSRKHIIAMATKDDDGNYPFELITDEDARWYKIKYFKTKSEGKEYIIAYSSTFNFILIVNEGKILKIDDPAWKAVLAKVAMLMSL